MASKIMKDGRIRWKGRVQKMGQIKQKLFNTKAEALAWEAQERAADWEAKTDTACSLKDWAEKYLDHAGKYDRKTYNEKRQALRELFAATTGKGKARQQIVNPMAPVTSLTSGKVLAALRAQFGTRSGNALNKDRKNLVAAWNWGVKYLGLPMPNPCLVDRFPEERHPRYIPSEEDFWKVYAQARGQDRIMLLCYLHLGARRSEIFRLAWEDVDFDNSRVRLYTRKRRDGSLEYDWLPMTDELASSLRWWWENRTFPDSTHVFICEDKTGFCRGQYGKPFKQRLHFMAELCRRAKVKPFGFHAIRHLTATILYKMGQPVSVIQAILRHKSPTTTSIYLHKLGLEETRGALEGLAARFVDTHDPTPGNGFGNGSGRVVKFKESDDVDEGRSVIIRRRVAAAK
ncbi:MAG: tyrosine-type recombinase/integrase [Lachnospiraceae bacterium]|nr:tyrosine-type recombinase/integrase [Lachnospiraceae bacterium]